MSLRHKPVGILLRLSLLLPLIGSTAAAQDTVSRGLAPSTVRQQEMPAALDALVDAFRHGDAAALMRHSAGRLDVTIFGVSELFSRSQAGYVLRDFFAQYRPERLDMTEMSGSVGNWFAAGRYWHAGGDAPLAVYLRLRIGDGAWELREVRIGRTIDR